MSPRTLLLLASGTLAWLAAMAGGFAALQRYAMESGRAEKPQKTAADFLARHRQPGRPLLIMALHPRCPCSEASLAELGDLLARSRGACDALLLEFEPTRAAPAWPPTPTLRQLGGVPVPVLRDPDGIVAATLGAHTSGHVVFTDKEGVPRLHGGLTVSRGHRGRALLQDAILDALKGEVPTVCTTPVFGCALTTDRRETSLAQ